MIMLYLEKRALHPSKGLKETLLGCCSRGTAEDSEAPPVGEEMTPSDDGGDLELYDQIPKGTE